MNSILSRGNEGRVNRVYIVQLTEHLGEFNHYTYTATVTKSQVASLFPQFWTILASPVLLLLGLLSQSGLHDPQKRPIAFFDNSKFAGSQQGFLERDD